MFLHLLVDSFSKQLSNIWAHDLPHTHTHTQVYILFIQVRKPLHAEGDVKCYRVPINSQEHRISKAGTRVNKLFAVRKCSSSNGLVIGAERRWEEWKVWSESQSGGVCAGHWEKILTEGRKISALELPRKSVGKKWQAGCTAWKRGKQVRATRTEEGQGQFCLLVCAKLFLSHLPLQFKPKGFPN